jgi:hypothetical protein
MTRNDLQKIIASGDLKKAVSEIMEATSGTSDESTAMMLSARLSRLERNELMGIMSYSDANMERNRLTQSLLSVLSGLDDSAFGTRPPQPITIPDPTSTPSSPASPPVPKKMFISYAREDFEYVERLKRFMYPLQREGLIETWSDSNLAPGQSWNDAIQKEMEEADIILYMISVDFLNSRFINEHERIWANKHVNDRGTIIVPVIVRPAPWSAEDFARYNAIPKDTQGRLTPLSQWSDQDSANLALVDQLRGILN